MPNQLTLEELEQQITRLPWQDQLKLIARISEHLSIIPSGALKENLTEDSLQKHRERKADRLLAICNAAASLWEGTFDAVEDIRKMRQERDDQIWH